ncbi:MAG: hypothetical protein KAJ51_06050, partial [Thermoplasmata archaeon]|nr:hypothetical protein [Thermoplasmata archaeon]
NGVLQAKAGSLVNDDRYGDIWTWDGPSYDPNYGRTVLVRHPIARSWRITDKGDILSPIIQNIAHWAVGTHYTLEDCSLDVGNTGGTKDWNNLGQFQGTASVNNFAAKLNQVLPTLPYFEDDYGNQFVDVPLNFTTSTYGSFLLSDLEIEYTYTAVIDKKPDNNNLAIALNDIIPAANEVNQTGQDFVVYIGVYSDSPCKVKLSELEITYNGAPKCSDIPDTYSVPEDSYDEYLIDLTSYFTDDYQSSEYLDYEVVSYTNHEYVDVDIFDRFYLGVSAEQEPNTNWFGETKVVVSARDSDGVKTKSNMFTVTIAEINDDPEIGLTIPNINLTTNETNLDIDLDAEATVSGTFGYYFTDIDSETLYYKAIVSPAAQQHVLANIDAGNILNLTAIGNYRLNIPVRIFCDDELAAIKTLNDFNYDGLYQSINVNITTFSGKTPPTWYDLPDAYIPEGQVRKDWLDLRDYVIDMDDRIENLTFSIVSVSNSAYITIAIGSVGIVDILPTPNFDGISKVTLKAEDDEHYYTTESFTVYMIPKNDIPTITILTPNERDIVAGKVNIEGSAYDIENTLELIELKFGDESDGWVPAEGLTFWKFVWDTVEFAPDTPQFVTIYARAYDGQNYSEHAELDIVINNQNIDADNDGHPNTEDLFPNDPSEWADTDGDGYGNNRDLFPFNESEWADSDGDTVGDNIDAFPFSAADWLDTDGDGYGDNTDAYPNDPTRYKVARAADDTEMDSEGSIVPYMWVIVAVIVIINVLIFIALIMARRQEKSKDKDTPNT